MPSALYLGRHSASDTVNYAILCHGAIDIRFNHSRLLSSDKQLVFQKIEDLDTEFIESIWSDTVLDIFNIGEIAAKAEISGFVWFDHMIEAGQDFGAGARSAALGEEAINKFLTRTSRPGYQIKAIITGHQHSRDMMDKMVENGGIYNSWSERQWTSEGEEIPLSEYKIVWTLSVSPDSQYGQAKDYAYATYAILKMTRDFSGWTLKPKNVYIDYE